jgi:hypothetical protein
LGLVCFVSWGRILLEAPFFIAQKPKEEGVLSTCNVDVLVDLDFLFDKHQGREICYIFQNIILHLAKNSFFPL